MLMKIILIERGDGSQTFERFENSGSALERFDDLKSENDIEHLTFFEVDGRHIHTWANPDCCSE